MKTIGLIGGMSWESTITYYQLINETVKTQLGGLHSAKCMLYSVDFAEIEKCQARGEWAQSGAILAAAAQALERGGADFIVICTNTMHKMVDLVQAAVGIPILHIADVTAAALSKKKINQVALLGTKYTMEQEFYKSRLVAQGIAVIIPDAAGIELVNQTIYQELCLGRIQAESKRRFLELIGQLAAEGAQGVILGCTEIGLLIQQQDTLVPLFDTAVLHAQAAAMKALDQ